MCEGVSCVELVWEFYVNIHSTGKEARTLKSYVRGKYLDFSITDICDYYIILPLPPEIVGVPYNSSNNVPSLHSLAQLLLTKDEDWPPNPSSHLKQKGLKDVFRVLNHVLCNMFLCTSHAESDTSSRVFLPFGLLIKEFLAQRFITLESHVTHHLSPKPISKMSFHLSNAHFGVAPPPPHLETHVMDLDPPEEVAATDISSTSVAPPSTASTVAPSTIDFVVASNKMIANAIATLFAYVNVIHSNLIHRIGLVHE
ncbi:hypothetical protein Acr_10g0007950 [Actinidia rufa]|uniref:Putative plant transposon protein domain-containing protein n=1 Tax=Actinidia rufa TaxID=165716 RepID=A0A7J0F9N6_9ERIC|nr:hypothetical protein Acr_10g0007950 [Actinidia rufa]